MKILILCGDDSNEREISIRSGRDVAAALSSQKHDVTIADPSDQEFDLKKLATAVDVVLPILHGKGGEDGTIQTELESLGVPYLGSGPTASKLGFDKAKFKDKIHQNGILTPRWEVVDEAAFRASPLKNKPYVLKPIDEGSSIDMHVVRDPTQEIDGVQALFERRHTMLLEEFIDGHIVTIGVLGSVALPLLLINPPEGEEFDYINKANGKTQKIISPTYITDTVQRHAQALALQVHQLIDCRHLSRVDMIIRPDGSVYVLEINTIPGMTTHSSFPIAAKARGLAMPALMHELIGLATKTGD